MKHIIDYDEAKNFRPESIIASCSQKSMKVVVCLELDHSYYIVIDRVASKEYTHISFRNALKQYNEI